MIFFTIGGVGLFISVYPIIKSEIEFEIKQRIQAANDDSVIIDQSGDNTSFGEILLIAPPLSVVPVNKSNSLIIEKIDVNSPVIWDVNVIDENAYNEALKNGVAHALGTQLPTEEPGNTYIFAHSTLNPLEIERYSAVFTLLHRLEPGDSIIIFKDEIRYDYVIESKDIVGSFDLDPLKRQPDYPMLTLQTCDPPGVPLNRLIITAKLFSVY